MLKTKCFSCGKDIIKKDENKVVIKEKFEA